MTETVVKHEKPGWLTGVVIGVLLAVPLVILLGVASQLFGTPFAPFDLFNVVRDNLPGGVLTFGIDLMVDSMRALNVPNLDSAAKTAEQGFAIVNLLLVLVVATTLFFIIMRSLPRSEYPRYSIVPGVVLGLMVGLPMSAISTEFGLTAQVGDMASIVFTVVVFLVWGVLIQWTYLRLMQLPTATTPAPVAA